MLTTVPGLRQHFIHVASTLSIDWLMCRPTVVIYAYSRYITVDKRFGGEILPPLAGRTAELYRLDGYAGGNGLLILLKRGVLYVALDGGRVLPSIATITAHGPHKLN
jgi:hypothetical protein